MPASASACTLCTVPIACSRQTHPRAAVRTRTCGDSRPATSSTCAPSPRPGASAKSCKRCLHKSPGTTTSPCWRRLDDERVRLWYAAKAREAGWSRNVLAVQIENRQHERQGNAVTNFPRTLPPSDSDLATQAFKDPSSSPMSEAAGTSPISGQYCSPNGSTISIRASPARPYASLRTTGRAGRTR